MAYAEKTEVAVEKSIAEIITLIKRAGAQRIGQFEQPDRFVVQFELADRLVKFAVKLPSIEEMPDVDHRGYRLTNQQRISRRDQRHRQRARALLLVIKAKLESVESEVENFEQAFLANIVMADGATIYERIAEPIALEYRSGAPVTMLLTGPAGEPANG